MDDKPKAPLPMTSWLDAWSAWQEYALDASQRSVLFWDIMRQRSDQYFDHKKQPVPNVLEFAAELVLDGRNLQPAANYLLTRIVPPAGVIIDQAKRPFVVVDPRAGHGPGIGGFKADSEIGVAMAAGHPCYFIGFTPDPVPGQTIEDVMSVEAALLEKVIDLHPDADGRPAVIGNCQAGWAVAMLAAIRPELFGPIIVAGAPLSYWAGWRGMNPLRYSGGLTGGSWLTAMTGDMGHGKFDGAWLVTNFEKMNPANTLWSKQYNVWANADTEGPRYLGFEKWWGGHVNLNAAEIQWIVDELFIGNKLATADIVTKDGTRIDLRNIASPIICFCSRGDDITPPPQALGWILDLYKTEREILAHQQTIVYMVHDHIGHLGIFVSGSVAKKEHQEFASNIDLIDILPPGLYEAVLRPKTGELAHEELAHGDWIVSFERRKLADVAKIVQPLPEDELRFATARRVSEINLGLYRTFVQPIVQATSNEQTAAFMHKVQPSELPYELFSDRNPAMRQVRALAEQVRADRRPASPDNPFLLMQKTVSEQVVSWLDGWKNLRDQSQEQMFQAVYGSPLLQALTGLKASDGPVRPHPGDEPEHRDFVEGQIHELRASIAKGGAVEAVMRAVMYVMLAGPGLDERMFGMVRQLRSKRGKALPLPQFKEKLRQQYFTLLLDENEALAAIPGMLPDDPGQVGEAKAAVQAVCNAVSPLNGEMARRLARVEMLLTGPPAPVTRLPTGRQASA